MAYRFAKSGNQFVKSGNKFVRYDSTVSDSSLLIGLISYWKLDETDGSTLDSHTNSYNGSLVNNPTRGETGKIGSAYTFSDVSLSYVTMGINSALEPAHLTAAGWFKITGTKYDCIVSNINSSLTSGFALTTEASKMRGRLGSSLTAVNLDGTTTINTGDWFHVAMTSDGSRGILYINGVMDTSVPYADIVEYTGTSQCMIGARASGSQNFDGTIDEVGIWDRALTEQEVYDLYNAGYGLRYPFSLDASVARGLLSYWNCDETSGTVLSDSLGVRDLSTSATVNANGLLGKAVEFESTGVVLYHDFDPATNVNYPEFSYSLWLYPNQTPSSAGRIYQLIRVEEAGVNAVFSLGWPTSNYINCGVVDFNGTLYYSDTNSQITLTGEWIHLVAVYGGIGTKIQLYINNSNVTASWSTVCVSENLTHTKYTVIGNLTYDNSSRTFDGKMDEIGMWKRALTANDVSILYNAGAGRTYPFI